MRFIGNYREFKLSPNYGGWTVVGQLKNGGCIIIGEVFDTDAAKLLASALNERASTHEDDPAVRRCVLASR